MLDKFKGLYRIPSARAVWWDYSQAGLYFVTICTQGMSCCLGKIENNKIQLSSIGIIAENCWKDIPNHLPGVKLHAMVVMPNHVHGIVEILPASMAETLHATSVRAHPASMGETLRATSLQVSSGKNSKMAAISPRKGSLASIVRSYKSAVSKMVHPLYPEFCWQERYFDNIIKDIPAYQRIAAYIENNVSSWHGDK